jgi:hypothetical protein
MDWNTNLSRFTFVQSDKAPNSSHPTFIPIASLPSPALTAADAIAQNSFTFRYGNTHDTSVSPNLPQASSPPRVFSGSETDRSLRSIQQFVGETLHNPRLPPVLFRVYNKGSKGTNEVEGFQSERMTSTGRRVSPESMTWEDFRKSVVDHLNNVMFRDISAPKGTKRKDKQNARRKGMKSKWISTSSSLLTSLQRAAWMVQKGFQDITLAAIDTASLKKEEYAGNVDFICAVPELYEFLGHTETRKHIKFNCNEEYLVLNQIYCTMSHIPFQQLYDAGIKTLLPALELKRVKAYLNEGLATLRKILFDQAHLLTENEVKLCKMITKQFFKGQRCNLIFYALLALKRRPSNDPAIDGIVKNEMRRWRYAAAFDDNGLVKADNLFYFRYEFDFSRPHESTHEEVTRFAEIGLRLTQHNRNFEKRIGRQIMCKIWSNSSHQNHLCGVLTVVHRRVCCRVPATRRKSCG